jgi:hypothetical protein
LIIKTWYAFLDTEERGVSLQVCGWEIHKEEECREDAADSRYTVASVRAQVGQESMDHSALLSMEMRWEL